MKRFIVLALLLLTALASAGAAPVAAEGQAGGDARGQLDEILRRPLFRAWREREEARLPEGNVEVPEAFTDWVRRVGRAIGDFFDSLFRSRGRSSSSSGTSVGDVLPTLLQFVAWLALAAALIAVVVILFRVFGKGQVRVPTAKVLSRQQVRRALEAGDALALDSSQWMDEAQRLASEQDFRAVYRALYLALLAGLHTLGKIEHGRNRTNWAYVRHYRGPDDERQTFAELTELFDRVWYGRKGTDGQDIGHLRTRVAALTQAGGRN